MVELATANYSNQQHVETSSTNDSLHESDSSSGASSESVPSVVLPSEAVLFFDNLDNYFAEFGKVSTVIDVNEYIQVQYHDKESALRL